MPRQYQGRTIRAEDQMRANIRRLLLDQDRSAAWLSRKLREAGCKSGSTAIWRILNEGRTIHVNEAIAIADAFDVDLTDLWSA